jgi:hypothetical protein
MLIGVNRFFQYKLILINEKIYEMYYHRFFEVSFILIDYCMESNTL